MTPDKNDIASHLHISFTERIAFNTKKGLSGRYFYCIMVLYIGSLSKTLEFILRDSIAQAEKPHKAYRRTILLLYFPFSLSCMHNFFYSLLIARQNTPNLNRQQEIRSDRVYSLLSRSVTLCKYPSHTQRYCQTWEERCFRQANYRK